MEVEALSRFQAQCHTDLEPHQGICVALYPHFLLMCPTGSTTSGESMAACSHGLPGSCISRFIAMSSGLQVASRQISIPQNENTSSSSSPEVPSLCSTQKIWTRRGLAFPILASVVSLASAARAEEPKSKEDESNNVLQGILSIFDPDETTKSGKKLPKSYLKAARELVKTLRESLQKDPAKEQQKFREAANTARDAIREYLTSWKGSKTVETQDSYRELEKALRELGRFYSRSGPTAVMPENIKSEILQNLSNAEADL